MSGANFLEMSDEDFLNATPPEVTAEPAQGSDGGENKTATPPAAEPEGEPELPAAEPEAPEQEAEEPAPAAETPPAEAPEGGETQVEAQAPTEPEKPVAEKPAEVDYAAAYKRIMAPFKANGRMIEPQSIDEVIQLAQMGANYTRKMQELAPQRKLLQMLQNHGLTNEAELGFLIDLKQKNPEAIKKLVRDAGIDPMEIDTSKEPAYQPGNHKVTDAEVAFQSTLSELQSDPAGQETVRVISTTWDDGSKELLWNNPDVMTMIHQQREAGIYDRIVAEVERRKTLGQLGTNVGFLAAYKAVGDQLQAAGKFADLVQAQPAASTPPAPSPPPAPAAPAVIATRVATPKPAAANADKAAAASTTRTVPTAAKPLVNPLAMSDEEFMKLSGIRV